MLCWANFADWRCTLPYHQAILCIVCVHVCVQVCVFTRPRCCRFNMQMWHDGDFRCCLHIKQIDEWRLLSAPFCSLLIALSRRIQGILDILLSLRRCVLCPQSCWQPQRKQKHSKCSTLTTQLKTVNGNWTQCQQVDPSTRFLLYPVKERQE